MADHQPHPGDSGPRALAQPKALRLARGQVGGRAGRTAAHPACSEENPGNCRPGLTTDSLKNWSAE